MLYLIRESHEACKEDFCSVSMKLEVHLSSVHLCFLFFFFYCYYIYSFFFLNVFMLKVGLHPYHHLLTYCFIICNNYLFTFSHFSTDDRHTHIHTQIDIGLHQHYTFSYFSSLCLCPLHVVSCFLPPILIKHTVSGWMAGNGPVRPLRHQVARGEQKLRWDEWKNKQRTKW